MDHIARHYMPILVMILLTYRRFNISNEAALRNLRKKMRPLDFHRLRVLSDDVAEIINGNTLKTQAHLRVNSQSFYRILELLPDGDYNGAKEYELMIFLYWMAAGCKYKQTGSFVGISPLAVKIIVHKMLDYFIEYIRYFIRKPAEEARPEIGVKFCTRSGSNIFADAIGAIDIWHIRVKCPENRHHEYINKKKFYSIQCQAVVDSNFLINDIFIGYPGSVSKKRIFRISPISRNVYTSNDTYLLGDNGFPCQLSPLAVITPFKTANVKQHKFNIAHGRARSVVDCTFRLLKTRWPNIFNKSLGLKIEICVKTVVAACVLHNICISEGDLGPMPQANAIIEDVDLAVDDTNKAHKRDTPEGIILRNRLLQQLA